MLTRILSVGLLAGLLAGLLIAALQQGHDDAPHSHGGNL
jgi:hypothetical protein